MHAFASELITRLGTTSVQTALLVTLVWALCRALPRLPAAAQCWLWWLVSLQAVLGLCAVPLELALLPAPVPQAPALAVPVAASVTASLSAVDVVMSTTPPPAAASAWSWALALTALWLAGVLLMLVRTLWAWRQTRQLLRRSQPCRDAHLLGALRLAAQAHGLRAAPALRLSPDIDSPQLVGPWRPVLLLPATRLATMADDDLDMALTHELVHLRRADLWWGLLPALAQHLLFFHPLLHLAVREYAIAREAACDSAVVDGHRHCRQHYGRLLLQLGVAPRPQAGLASASPSFLSLKRRLLMLQNTRSFPRLGAALIVAAVALAGVAPLRLVAKPVPPAPPAPPAAPLPPAQAAIPAPPAPPAAAALPAPAPRAAPMPQPAPSPPEAPAAPEAPPPMVSHGRVFLHHEDASGSGDGNAYVLVQGNHHIVDGSVADIHEAGAAAGGTPALWIRRDGQRYLVRDTATVKQFAALHAPSRELADAQARIGDRQGELGKRQGDLGLQMGEIGRKAGEAAAAQARAALDRPDAVDHQRIARIASDNAERALQEKGLQAKMEQLAAQQAALAREQMQLAQQQRASSDHARREADALIQRAIANGTAKPIKG